MEIAAALVVGFVAGFALSEYRRRRRAAGAVMLEQFVREMFEQQRVEQQRAQELQQRGVGAPAAVRSPQS
jgi:hypothetical protein